MSTKPKNVKCKTIDEYFAGLGEAPRAALESLRKDIHAAAPGAEECIGYQLPAFRLDGRMVVSFGATANHCALYLMSTSVLDAFRSEIKGLDSSGGTIRFHPQTPLPAPLVRKLVKARIAENAALRQAKTPADRPANPAMEKPLTGATGKAAVDEYLRKIDHPMKPVLEALRQVILGVKPEIREGIKWNAPSFHYKDYFATAAIRSADFVQVVFHRGAKVKDNATVDSATVDSGKVMSIPDPLGMLEWHAKDRCSAKFYSTKDVKSKAAALVAIVKQWIERM